MLEDIVSQQSEHTSESTNPIDLLAAVTFLMAVHATVAITAEEKKNEEGEMASGKMEAICQPAVVEKEQEEDVRSSVVFPDNVFHLSPLQAVSTPQWKGCTPSQQVSNAADSRKRLLSNGANSKKRAGVMAAPTL